MFMFVFVRIYEQRIYTGSRQVVERGDFSVAVHCQERVMEVAALSPDVMPSVELDMALASAAMCLFVSCFENLTWPHL